MKGSYRICPLSCHGTAALPVNDGLNLGEGACQIQ